MNKLKRNLRIVSFIFYLILIGSSIYIVLDTFVIPHEVSTSKETQVNNLVSQESQSDKTNNNSINDITTSKKQITDTSYIDDNISINITTARVDDTTYYVADISVSDAKYLKTAFANNTYGRNVKETTSQIAEENNAIFAINGDYYGFRNYGYVIRNGVLYRDVAANDTEALVIDDKGNFSIVKESDENAQSLLDNGAWQVLSFGPGLIENSEIVVNQNDEVAQAKSSNPRTAIGQIDSLHYIVVIADGRSNESQGLSLYELAQIMKEYKCTTAYNLDGGGSSTMYFNGKVINNPTDGRSNGERSVSDIVYFGY